MFEPVKEASLEDTKVVFKVEDKIIPYSVCTNFLAAESGFNDEIFTKLGYSEVSLEQSLEEIKMLSVAKHQLKLLERF